VAERNSSGAAATERTVVITRTFDAPRELVFKAWTDAKHLAQWWGPKGFTNPICEVDARPGGALRIVMRAPDGAEHPMTGVFREVRAPARLVFTNVAVDRDGKPLLEGLTTVTFAEQGGKTKLTVESRAVGLVAYAARMLEGMEAGWTQSIDRLGDHVARMRAATTERSAEHASFVIERSYDASPAQVFEAWADPAAKAHWFIGPAEWKATRRELDFREGGRERLSGIFPGGRTSDYDARYWDIVRDRRIVFTYGMHVDGKRISVSLATVELEPAGAGTRLIFTEQAVFLDGFVDGGGRERGTRAHLERLDAALKSSTSLKS
jgi:uncharacterized protein YndB with AHSA1/START domain